MRIYIPTYKRPNDQITFINMPDSIREMVIMVVQSQEYTQGFYDQYDCEKFVVGDNIGIAKTRELIYRHAGEERFGMIDDDIKIYRRNTKYYDEKSNMDSSKRLLTEEDWKYWIEEVQSMFVHDDIMHLGSRILSLPPYGERYYENKFIRGVHWIDGRKLQKFIDDVDWNYAQIGEDLILTLECLMKGYRNVTFDEFLIAAWETAFNDGGCSELRTNEICDEEMFKIAKKYPFVHATNQFNDLKKIGRVRKFVLDFKEAYKSSYTKTLEEFYD